MWREVVLPDLKYCIDNAAFPDNTLGESNFGRPSKGAAYALRGMAYMWLKEWQNAANDFEKVGQCGYGLWQGEYIDFFSPDNERDKEMIFAIQYDEESGYCDNIQPGRGRPRHLRRLGRGETGVGFRRLLPERRRHGVQMEPGDRA